MDISLFQAAADFVEESVQLGIPEFTDDVKLRLYGLYKQSLCGPVQDTQPSLFQPKQRSKWNAWKGVSQLTQEEAQRGYIRLVTEIEPEWHTQEKPIKNSAALGAIFSRPIDLLDTTPESNTHDSLSQSKSVLVELMSCGMDVDQWKARLGEARIRPDVVDSEGRSALHWAADEATEAAIDILIAAGVDVNSQDTEGMTPLHYAALCGHKQVAEKLTSSGARWDIEDRSGEAPSDMAPSDWTMHQT